MESLVRAYVEALCRPVGARGRGAIDEGGLHDGLTRALATATAAHPNLRVDDRVFAAHLGRCAPEKADPASALAKMNVADLYLACACLEGVPGAAETVEHLFRPTIGRYLSRLEMSTELFEDVTQALLARLLVPEPGRPAALAEYEGRGALGQWIGISAQRLALDTNRADLRRLDLIARLAEEPVALRLAPEDSLVRHRYRPALEAALKEAVKALDRRDRTIMRFHLAGRVSQRRIAMMYGVDRTTISRQLARAHQQVWNGVRERMAAELHLSSAEVESILRGVESQLDISLSSALASSGGDAGK